MSIAELLQEFETEAKTTRRMLERVPTDKLSWAPHAKSMSLGKLAMHTAGTPGMISGWALEDSKEFGHDSEPVPQSTADILAAHDASAEATRANLTKLTDAGLGQMWKASAGGQEIMTLPKAVLIRAIVLNHWIHHRGQLSVYLRLLDVPVPSIYGPSADENPFG